MTRPTIIFDDTCTMCTRSARVVRWFDWFRRFDTAGWYASQSTFPELARTDIDDGLRVRFADASHTVGIDAIRSIAMRTPIGALLGWLLYVPPVRAIAKRVYAVITRNRHRACRIDRRRD